MSDPIDRQAAIRWVKTECNPYGKPTLDFESGKKVIEHLEQMPPAQPGWISVTERLPMENNSYLVWMPFTPKGHHITVAEWCGSYWNIKTPIMAWMPLPEPWKG